MQTPGKSSSFGRAGDESFQTRAEHKGKDAVMCSFRGRLPLSPSLPPPVYSLSSFSSPGRLSNQEEMLGLSQCRPKDQMCGLEVVRQTKYKPAYRDTSEDRGQ